MNLMCIYNVTEDEYYVHNGHKTMWCKKYLPIMWSIKSIERGIKSGRLDQIILDKLNNGNCIIVCILDEGYRTNFLQSIIL